MYESHAHFKRQGKRDHAEKVGKFAHGGDVGQDKKMVKMGVHEHESNMHKGERKTRLKLKDGGNVTGEPSKKRLDRANGGGVKGGKKSGNHVNVIIAPPGKDRPVPMPMPGAGAMPPPHPPMAPPPGAPPGGPPGMPPGGGMAGPPRPPMPPGMGGPPPGGMPMRAAGGRFAKGGSVPHLTGGGGGATARLEKIKSYGAASKKEEGPVSVEKGEGPDGTEDFDGKKLKRGGAC